MLYVVPTPIGNLEDITLRAITVLKKVDMVIAEDTRKSGLLLKHLDIQKQFIAFHLHNEHQVLDKICNKLEQNIDLALITDAGTPAISDPGFLLVRECIKRGIKVDCLPGATAFVPAIVVSGLPCERFSFEGFLPVKKGRQTRLTQLIEETRTMVFYESPHRLTKTLEQMISYFGANRQVSVSREITKFFEEHQRGTLQEVLDYYLSKTVKGEIVIVLQGADYKAPAKKKKWATKEEE